MHVRNPMEWAMAQFRLPAALGSAAPDEYWPAAPGHPDVRKITAAALAESLRRGVDDFLAARTDIVFVVLIYPVVALVTAMAEAHGALIPLLFPTASGFALLGPLFAIGLYEMSRQRERTGTIRWLDTFQVLRAPSLGPICYLAALLIGLFLAWLAVAQGIYAVTLGTAPRAFFAFLNAVFTTAAGWEMILLGTAAGAGFAVAVLAISVVSFPLLLDRPVRFATAITTSLHAMQENPGVLALWGLIVAGGLLLGALPCFIGLVVVLPVLGHATWHLYRAIVR